MRIRRLFSSVLAGLALMYASGCNSTCQQVAGYNVYGYPYGAPDTQAIAYNAAYNPGYDAGTSLVAPAPAAVTYNYPQSAPKARVKRSKARYARPTKQRFTQQVNPYVYGQPVAGQVVPASVINANVAPAGLNYVPTITTNTDGVPGLTTAGVAHDPSGGVVYQPNYQPNYQVNPGVTYAPASSLVPVQTQAAGYNYGVPAGSNVQCQTVYRRGRPIRQRYRKVRWEPIQTPQPAAPVYQAPVPVYQPPVYQAPMPEPIPYTPPVVVEPYTPPAEPFPMPEPEPIPAPQPEVRREPTIIDPIIEPKIQPHITPLIEPTIRTRIEPAVPVEQPVQQPIIQPVVIQPIIQPVIQAPVQAQVEPMQIAMPEPVYQQQPVYTPPPAPAYVPPAPTFPEPTGSAYCPPDICPVPNPVVCQPGQNLSECFTLNEYQILNSPSQIYTPSASGPLAISPDLGSGTASMTASAPGGYTMMSTPAGQVTTSKYEALPMPDSQMGFGTMSMNTVPSPMGQTDNIPPVPAATEIEHALDAMLSRDQRTPNLK